MLQLGKNLLSLLQKLLGHRIGVVDFLPQIGHIVGHVGVLQELIFRANNFGVVILAGAEFEQREDEVAVEIGNELGQQVILVGDFFSGFVGCGAAEKGLSGRRNVGCHGEQRQERDRGGGDGEGMRRDGGFVLDEEQSVRLLFRFRKCGREGWLGR